MKKWMSAMMILTVVMLLASCGRAEEENSVHDTRIEIATQETEMASCELTPEPDSGTVPATETITITETRGPAAESTMSPDTTTAVTTVTTTKRVTTLPPWVTTEPIITLASAPAPVVGTPISAILLYSYNAFSYSSGHYGYTYYYFTPTLTETGQTYKTKPDLTDPTATENKVNVVSIAPAEGTFEKMCEELYAAGLDKLPETVEVDETRIIMDGSHRYIVIYFEDGSAYTSEGYCADSYHANFKNVYDLLRDYGTAK